MMMMMMMMMMTTTWKIMENADNSKRTIKLKLLETIYVDGVQSISAIQQTSMQNLRFLDDRLVSLVSCSKRHRKQSVLKICCVCCLRAVLLPRRAPMHPQLG